MVKIDYSDFLPRTQADRYTHAMLEQLIKLNENIEKLIPKEQITIAEPVELPKKTRRKKNE